MGPRSAYAPRARQPFPMDVDGTALPADLPPTARRATAGALQRDDNWGVVRRDRDCRPAPWHELVSRLFWYRIYTTNIDDVIQNSYGAATAQRLRTIVCPAPYQEHDIWFEAVQCVHLRGSVTDPSKGFTFAYADFAAQTTSPNPWYQALVDDMYTKAVVFVGTRLGEAPFYHYLQMRAQRGKGAPEFRERQLEAQNMVVLPATAQEFLETLVPEVEGRVPTRFAPLKGRYPHQIGALTANAFESQSAVLRQFEFVQVAPPVQHRPTATRTQFFLGAEPTWDDIRDAVDAMRAAAAEFLELVNRDADGKHLFVLSGHAGSGKSTMLKRLAFELEALGRNVYFAKDTSALETGPVLEFMRALAGRRVYFFVDDAANQLEGVAEIIEQASDESAVMFVVADRPHVLDPRLSRLRVRPPQFLEMPELNSEDCARILDKLEALGFLGALQGKSRQEQLRDFLGRSRKQLLVAMKEATSGRGFDVIIADEYNSLAGEARLAYTIACACYMHGAPVRRRHLLACLSGTDLEKANVLVHDLKQILVPWKGAPEYLSPRHRVIARQVIGESAPIRAKVEAATIYLSQIAADITPETISRRTPEYLAYRGIINFDNVRFMCGDDYETIGALYNELRAYYAQDFLFWLQWGRAEVYFDHFDIAENHLNQSLGIRDAGNFQARHYLGVLFLKKGAFEDNAAAAADAARRGEDILRREITARGHLDAYPSAALVTHKLRFLRKWGSPHLAGEIEDLYRIARTAYERHPFDDAMREAYQEVYRAYLMLAVPATDGTPDAESSGGN